MPKVRQQREVSCAVRRHGGLTADGTADCRCVASDQCFITLVAAVSSGVVLTVQRPGRGAARVSSPLIVLLFQILRKVLSILRESSGEAPGAHPPLGSSAPS